MLAQRDHHLLALTVASFLLRSCFLSAPAEEEDLQRSRLSMRRGGGGGGGRLSAEDLQRLREQQALADQVGCGWLAPHRHLWFMPLLLPLLLLLLLPLLGHWLDGCLDMHGSSWMAAPGRAGTWYRVMLLLSTAAVLLPPLPLQMDAEGEAREAANRRQQGRG